MRGETRNVIIMKLSVINLSIFENKSIYNFKYYIKNKIIEKSSKILLLKKYKRVKI